MDFYSPINIKKPIRLSEETRQFAYESLNHKYGQLALKTKFIELDDIENFGELSDYQRYDLAIIKIAERSPIRICENELISGVATLGGAIDHVIPATYKDNILFESVSHLTLGFDGVIKNGLNFYSERIKQKLLDENIAQEQVIFFDKPTKLH